MSWIYTKDWFAVQIGDRGTIQPKANFSATEDAVALKKAMKGLGDNTFFIHCWKTVISLNRYDPVQIPQ